MWQPKRASMLAIVLFFGIVQLSCAHRQASPRVSATAFARNLSLEANAISAIHFEEDFLDARFIYQGLPDGVPEKHRLREALLAYLLGKQASLDAETIRKQPSIVGSEETIQALEDSFVEAL